MNCSGTKSAFTPPTIAALISPDLMFCIAKCNATNDEEHAVSYTHTRSLQIITERNSIRNYTVISTGLIKIRYWKK